MRRDHFSDPPHFFRIKARPTALVSYRLPEFVIMQNTSTKVRPFNNDLMPHFATFRARLQAVRDRQTEAATSAAPALQSPSPHPTQLDPEQARMAMETVRQETQNGSSMTTAHSGLDPQRVARLLGILE